MSKLTETNKFMIKPLKGPKAGEAPIIKLREPMPWRVGDTILIASTGYDPRESEKFTLVDCAHEGTVSEIICQSKT